MSLLILVFYGAWIALVSAAMILRPAWCAEVAVRGIGVRLLGPRYAVSRNAPGNRLEKLAKDRAGQHSIRINH